jgi:malonate-semialdehyde dehydrogenase (acetylating) / methylmalonate-semialdehyde dehydrogenase
MTRIPHWIDGRRHPGRSGRHAPVYNPATGGESGQVDLASRDEVDDAVAGAVAAAAGWRSSSLSKRSGVLFAFRQLLHDRADDLAAVITAEHGKTHDDALGEITRGLENVEFAAGVPQLLKGGFSEQAATGVDVFSIRQPLGVVAGITPFNFPAMVPLWMCATAIACGNAFILKPSEKDPSAALLLAELWREAGLPDGVFTVLQGDREAVEALLAHPDVAAISFVGSTPVARTIYETGSAHGQRVQALGAPRTTPWFSPTPTSISRRTPSSPRPTGPPASAVWRCLSPSPWATSPTPWSTRSPSASPNSWWATAPGPARTWAR